MLRLDESEGDRKIGSFVLMFDSSLESVCGGPRFDSRLESECDGLRFSMSIDVFYQSVCNNVDDSFDNKDSNDALELVGSVIG